MCERILVTFLHFVFANPLSFFVTARLQDRVCRVVVTAFSERSRLSELLWAVLWQEAESALSPSTLYR